MIIYYTYTILSQPVYSSAPSSCFILFSRDMQSIASTPLWRARAPGLLVFVVGNNARCSLQVSVAGLLSGESEGWWWVFWSTSQWVQRTLLLFFFRIDIL